MGTKISDLLKNHITRKASCCGVQLEDLQKEYERNTRENPGVPQSAADPGESPETPEPSEGSGVLSGYINLPQEGGE